MRRSALLLAAVLGLLFPAEARPQTTGFTTKAIKEFSNALTNAGRFGVPRYATASLPTCAATNRGAVAFDTSTLSLKVCTGAAWAAPGGGGAAAITMNDDVPLAFGTAADNTRPAILFNTTETVDTGMLLTGTVSNHWVIAENQDKTFDFAHAAATNPTLFLHSANQSTTQWLSFAHDGTNSLIASGAGHIDFLPAGVDTFAVDSVNNEGRVKSTAKLGFSSNTPAGSASDAFFMRETTAIIQMGADVNGAAVAQTFKAPDAITGSNVKGGDFTVASGRGTGNAAASSVHIQVPSMLGTGTTAQVLADRFVACETKTLSNTSAVTTNIASVALASNSGGGVRISVSVRCDDGTNFDSDVVTSYVAFVNKATVLTIGTAVTTASAGANNSGSCTVAPTFTAGTNSVDINVTPVIGTITPTTTTAAVNIETFGVGAVTCK